MEVLLKKPKAVKEEKRSEIHENQDGGQGDFPKLASHETPKQNGNLSKSPSPKRKASPISNQEDNSNSSDRSSTKRPSIPSPLNAAGMNCKNQEEQLDSTRAEMGEVRQENERLRMVLSRILKDYQSLQMQFLSIAQQEDKSNNMVLTTPPISNQEITSMGEDNEESELVFLSLGTSSSAKKNSKEEKPNNTTSSGASKSLMDVEEIKMLSGGLTLGLGCKFEVSSTSAIGTQQQRSTANQSTEDSFEDATKEEEEEGGAVGEQWPPSKVLKTMRSGAGGVEDEVSQQAHVKKARVSVRARCDAPTMNDGCQWRKYGQKISKGNPCPRAYYRCTVAPACPVRKQVQRCADDMSILITTYEGTHNHPLPMAATPMASTTAAAASMLLSGSSSSSPSAHLGITSPLTTISSTLNTSSLRGLSFNLSDSSRPRPYYLPSTPSMSTSPSYPTITLDLTSPSPSTNQFNRFSSNLASSIPRYSNNLNFGPDSTAVGSWNASSGYLGYGSQLFNNKREIVGGSSAATPSPFYQSSYPLKSVTPTTPTNGATAASPAAPTQQALTDTLAKAITSDPSFQSALAAAITSIVGGSGGNNGSSTSQTVAEAVAQSLKLVGGDHGVQYFPSAAVTAAANGSGSGSGCATSFLNRPPPAAASHPGSLMFLQPSLGFSNPKSSSSSPVENSEHIN